MTKLKGAAILGGLILAGATLLSTFPAAGASSFLPVKPRQLQAACRALQGADGGLCSVTANLLKSVGSVDFDAPIPPEKYKQSIRILRPWVRQGLRQPCCDGPCVRHCSVTSDVRCLSNANCPTGETCAPCVPGPCQTPCSEFDGDRCGGCVQMISNLQAWLATNGSAQLLADAMASACAGRFDDPTACEDTLTTKSLQVIDRFLANSPPQTACTDRALRSCRP